MAHMQVLCDSIGVDFPTFPRFVAMLRDYERLLTVTPPVVAAPVVAPRLPDFNRRRLMKSMKRVLLADPHRHERPHGVPKSYRPIVVLPSGARHYCVSVAAAEIAIRGEGEWGAFADWTGGHIEWGP